MRKRIFTISLCLILIGNYVVSCIFAVPVFALSAGGLQTTIASIILSLFLQTGTAPVNQSFIDTLNTSYGVSSSIGTIQDAINSGLLIESGGALVDNGLSAAIESAPAYDLLDLESVFTTYTDEGVAVASGGVNLCNQAINVGTVGTIGAFAGAASIGVGLGVLVNKVQNYIGNFVKYGLPMSAQTRQSIAENFPSGYDRCYYSSNQGSGGIVNSHYYFVQDGIYGGRITDTTAKIDARGKNITNENKSLLHYRYDNSSLVTNESSSIRPEREINLSQLWVSGNYNIIEDNYPKFNTIEDLRQYWLDIENGEIEAPAVYSPDIIGENGNQKDGDVKNVIPSGYDMNPVSMDDYQDYVDNANDNTENGNVNQPVQGEEFDNLIDSLLVEPSIIPDQGVSDPEVPDRPIIPEQPVVPGKDPITGEQQSQVLEGITTPDLRGVFPFCIPFDLYALLGNLKYESREAPVIVWEFEFLGNTYPIIIDLSPYDEAAEILRLFELLLFIIGLAVNTRKLIGAGG